MRLSIAALFLLAVVGAYAKWRTPSVAPIRRLIENAESGVKISPEDADAWFLLARLHSLAYASTSEQTYVLDPDIKLSPFTPIQLPMQRPRENLKAETRAHLLRSIDAFEKACELNPKEALHWLGFGWLLKEAGMCSIKAQADGPIKAPQGNWFERAASAYRTAFHLSSVGDKGRGWMLEEERVSVEAAKDLIELYAKGYIKPEPGKSSFLKRYVDKADKFPTNQTPIIFPVGAKKAFTDLESPKASVRFDLDGSGLGRRWSWVTPNAAFLVWDPFKTGRITSGRQLFGNVTFWMFFRNGYAALASLDDNRDGELRGAELRFIAAWRDANSNGFSDPGEVRPLLSYGIVAIRVRAEGKRGRIWFNSVGLERGDGSTLPTYDWVGTGR
jgi:hypothetical protein